MILRVINLVRGLFSQDANLLVLLWYTIPTKEEKQRSHRCSIKRYKREKANIRSYLFFQNWPQIRRHDLIVMKNRMSINENDINIISF